MSAPYWGNLSPSGQGQTKARRSSLLDDQVASRERPSSLDASAEGRSRSNRFSIQTTKSDAPTDSTLSPFASPTASSFTPTGLTPRPPSLPYGATQYPPELLENRRRRRSQGHEQDESYASIAGKPPPAAPDVPRTVPSFNYPPVGSRRQPSQSSASYSGSDQYHRKMAAEEHLRTSQQLAVDKTRHSHNDPAVPRSHRVPTDHSLAAMDAAPANGGRQQRRTSAAEQSLHLSSRRTSAQRPKAVADRSPLQQLESALDSISKEDKRARVEAAERAARERAAAAAAATTTAANGAIQREENASQGGRARARRSSMSAKDAPPAASDQTVGIRRNLSFRERAARNDIKLPDALEDVATTTPPGRRQRRAKKYQGDPWPRRVSDPESIFNADDLPAQSQSTQRTFNDSLDGESLRDEDLLAYPASGKITRTPSQKKADQILGRGVDVPAPSAHNAPRQGQHNVLRKPMPPSAAAANPPPHGPANDRVEHAPETHQRAEEHHQISEADFSAREQLLRPGQGMYKPKPYLEEWKHATVGALTGALIDIDNEVIQNPSGQHGSRRDAASLQRRSNNTSTSVSVSVRPRKGEAYAGEYDERVNGMRPPTAQAIYPSIAEVQNGEFRFPSQSDLSVRSGLPFEPQHLAAAPRKSKGRSKRWDDLRPLSPSPPGASDSTDSLECFSLRSNDATLSRQTLIYSPPTRFKPPLYLKCGPLLRFCGIRHERVPNRSARNGGYIDREIWRGSIMIVTSDADSSYEIAPTLRLFVQPIELLPTPPRMIDGDESLSPEYVDPLAGHPKLGRKGETLYVRPVDHLEEGRDLSRDETDDGLFEKTRSPPDVPLPDGMVDPPGSFAARRKRAEMDGEKAGKYRDIRGFRLHAERGYTFWRFNIEVELRDKQQRIAYRINRGPSTGFWVPAKGQPMNIMFYSCNGFSLSVDSNLFSGPDPLWRDVLNAHQSQPFHVMIGGGDQIYNDRCMQDVRLFREWLSIKNPIHKHNAPFTPEMQDELEAFYLERYCMWFSQGLFGMANAQIPMVNMWDDHDIIDGFGSYPHHFMNSPVFSGLGNVAFKYYMLFQHQSIPSETEEAEPSWILGEKPGPYINELSRSLFMSMGGKVALLAVDGRTERTREEVVSEDTWKKLMDRCYSEIDKGKVDHLLVLLGVPIAYPRLVWLENILTSRVMDPIKALGKLGMLGGLLNKIDGGVEVLDDLDDHWTAKSHKRERSIVIEDLQDLAADKSVRVTILSGDVHLAAIGQFYSNPKLGLPKHKDFRYMPNVISSAIVNTPPPEILADVLNKRNKVHHFDKETDEDMIPLFAHGVDGKPRNNKHLLPHRNWCSIRPYVPGTTPQSTPAQSSAEVGPGEGGERRGSIFRRLSFRSRNKSMPTVGTEGSVSASGIPKDRSRPPISRSGLLLRSLSRRPGTASADHVGQANQQAGASKTGLVRTFSASNVAGASQSKFGGLFRRRSTASKKDVAVQTNGPDTDTESVVRHDQHDQPQTQSHQHAAYEEHNYSGPVINDEFQRGDEACFTAVRPNTSRGHKPTPTGLPHAATTGNIPQATTESTSDPKTSPFRRTPTLLTAKQRKHAEEYTIDLTGALEVTLNVEISPRDPGGSTVPYRLVVPKLWYDDEMDETLSNREGKERKTRVRESVDGEKVARPDSESGVRREDEETGVSEGEEEDRSIPAAVGEEKRGLKRLFSLKRRSTAAY